MRRQPKRKSASKIKTSKKSKARPKSKRRSMPGYRLKQNLPVDTQRQSQRRRLSSRPPSETTTFGPKAWKPRLQLKLKHKWAKAQNFSQSRLPQPKPEVHFRSKRMVFQNQSELPPPSTSRPGTHPVWDTSVQAAIRVGDWKLLTGYPGHGDWVPPQVGHCITSHLTLLLCSVCETKPGLSSVSAPGSASF